MLGATVVVMLATDGFSKSCTIALVAKTGDGVGWLRVVKEERTGLGMPRKKPFSAAQKKAQLQQRGSARAATAAQDQQRELLDILPLQAHAQSH